MALILLGETIVSPLWVWLCFAETPDPFTLAGGALLLSALIAHELAAMKDAAAASSPDLRRVNTPLVASHRSALAVWRSFSPHAFRQGVARVVSDPYPGGYPVRDAPATPYAPPAVRRTDSLPARGDDAPPLPGGLYPSPEARAYRPPRIDWLFSARESDASGAPLRPWPSPLRLPTAGQGADADAPATCRANGESHGADGGAPAAGPSQYWASEARAAAAPPAREGVSLMGREFDL